MDVDEDRLAGDEVEAVVGERKRRRVALHELGAFCDAACLGRVRSQTQEMRFAVHPREPGFVGQPGQQRPAPMPRAAAHIEDRGPGGEIQPAKHQLHKVAVPPQVAPVAVEPGEFGIALGVVMLGSRHPTAGTTR